jgi:hypothetical protein
MARTLQHLDGSTCPGPACERCLLDWALHGQVYYRLLDDAMDQELAGFKPLGLLPTATHIAEPG